MNLVTLLQLYGKIWFYMLFIFVIVIVIVPIDFSQGVLQQVKQKYI